MKIISTSVGELVKFIFRPRLNPVGQCTINIRSRSTNKTSVFQNVIAQTDSNYYQILISALMKAEMVENNYYDCTIFDNDGTLLARETFFVTNQTINQEDNDIYDPNKDAYKSVQSTNEYIIL